ncbi:16S rRNA (guanine(527)-N(7))-methyltransferase RsmG [Larsenimonas salina]|uniref:16S rRNA (guanine(527)-N(7))-methyltransferase RsmG n=1 Tax=Larsenimonas salina TaxID=1295565 RepID=UPI0020731EC3|nr:16S rRNA (guanine(527)-N(7))-methyltransferase RsmG [Larsenimonas salina]MCM5704699.1 16S rRNA (guanine(527)-N(7))-methyltransferase RsmG [Larsenimonas salina]
MTSIKTRLEQGIDAMGCPLSSEAIEQMSEFVALLHKWNRAYNLTAVRDPDQMVSRHVLDSLSVLPWVKGPGVLDVGSGAGIPGILLAIARPELQVTLLDGNGKKVRFQQHACRTLGLENVEPVHERLEQYHPEQGFDQIISRAFSTLSQFTETSQHLLAADGEWLAMKGRLDSEPDELPLGIELIETIELNVPNESGQRHLIRVRQLSA